MALALSSFTPVPGGLTAPTAPTVTVTGAAGTTSYFYKVVARNANGTVTGAEGSTTTGNAVLSGTNYNAVSWTAVAGATNYDLYRGSAAGAENLLVASALTTTSFNDVGGPTTAQTPPATNTTAVARGSSATPQTLTVTPDGSSDSIFAVKITGTDAAQFTTNETFDTLPPGLPSTAAYGQSTVVTVPTTFQVTYSPLASVPAPTTHNAVLEVHYNGVARAYTVTVPLQGTCV